MGKKQNLSDVVDIHLPDPHDFRIGIVTSQWNREITLALLEGAREHLLSAGIKPENIITADVPGSFELPLAAQYLLEYADVDGVICLGCIIQGETRHFEFIADAVASGIMKAGMDYNAPVSFGVLTTDNEDQARERSGGSHGNKGIEAAATVLSMLQLRTTLE